MSDDDSAKNSPRSEEPVEHGSEDAGMDAENGETMETTDMNDDQKTEGADKGAVDASKKVTIHVGDLPSYITTEDLRELFGKRGELQRCEVKTRGGRYCFVEYVDDSIAEEVLKDFKGLFLPLSIVFFWGVYCSIICSCCSCTCDQRIPRKLRTTN